MTFFGRRARLYVAFRVVHTSQNIVLLFHASVLCIYISFGGANFAERFGDSFIYLFFSLFYVTHDYIWYHYAAHSSVARVYT